MRVALSWDPICRSFYLLLKGGPISLQLRATFSPAPHWHAKTCQWGARAFHALYMSSGEWPGYPLLRASNEHRFTVRVLRARRAPGRSLPILPSPRVASAKKTNGLPLPSYTGQDERALGLLGDRTRVLELHIESEIHNVGFFNDVILAFQPEQPLLFHLRFRPASD